MCVQSILNCWRACWPGNNEAAELARRNKMRGHGRSIEMEVRRHEPEELKEPAGIQKYALELPEDLKGNFASKMDKTIEVLLVLNVVSDVFPKERQRIQWVANKTLKYVSNLYTDFDYQNEIGPRPIARVKVTVNVRVIEDVSETHEFKGYYLKLINRAFERSQKPALVLFGKQFFGKTRYSEDLLHGLIDSDYLRRMTGENENNGQLLRAGGVNCIETERVRLLGCCCCSEPMVSLDESQEWFNNFNPDDSLKSFYITVNQVHDDNEEIIYGDGKKVVRGPHQNEGNIEREGRGHRVNPDELRYQSIKAVRQKRKEVEGDFVLDDREKRPSPKDSVKDSSNDSSPKESASIKAADSVTNPEGLKAQAAALAFYQQQASLAAAKDVTKASSQSPSLFPVSPSTRKKEEHKKEKPTVIVRGHGDPEEGSFILDPNASPPSPSGNKRVRVLFSSNRYQRQGSVTEDPYDPASGDPKETDGKREDP